MYKIKKEYFVSLKNCNTLNLYRYVLGQIKKIPTVTEWVGEGHTDSKRSFLPETLPVTLACHAS